MSEARKEWIDRRVVLIDQEIDDALAQTAIAELLFLDDDAPGEIRVCVASPGGVVTSALAIYDAIKEMRNDVVTVAFGDVGGAALLPLVAGTRGKRYALAYVSLWFQGLDPQSSASADGLARLRDELRRIYALETGVEASVLDSMLSGVGVRISPSAANSMGFVDQVVDELPFEW